ncbi:hypothetical protein IWQ51_005932 [Labrenzia sp. EL_142]|nr:hypothetical protein [Labrenzia sp. EL_142]
MNARPVLDCIGEDAFLVLLVGFKDAGVQEDVQFAIYDICKTRARPSYNL